MSSKNDPLLSELQKCETKDEILGKVIKKTRAMTSRLRYSDSRIKMPSILFADFSKASESLKKSIFFADNCKVFFEPPLIIVNVAWLFELEAALRSFDLADSLLDSQYLKTANGSHLHSTMSMRITLEYRKAVEVM